MIIGADSTGVAEVNPFWTFSLALYKQPGVAEKCLSLQDEQGLDVNLLLYACFAAASEVALTEGDIAVTESACCRWREDKVKPLRALRRECEGELREKLLEAELLAERYQQGLIWASRSPAGEWPRATGATALLEGNLNAYARLSGVQPRVMASFKTLVEDLLRGLLPSP